jgi:two-component system nitrogen regulation sensor histidine kinase NtrY
LNRFYINLLIRLLLILVTMTFQAFAFNELLGGQYLFTFIVLSGFLLFQVVLLFRYLRRSNRHLTKFVLAISNQDFTLKFGKGKTGTPHKELNDAFNRIIEQYRTVSMEKESQTFLVHHLVKEIPAGILVINQESKVLIRNRAVEQLLALSGVRSLDEISHKQPEFYNRFLNPIRSGNFVYEHSTTKEQKKYSVSVNSFLLLNSEHKLVLVQDISKEVDAGEIDAMQRLMRILTHEIMNSLTPVNSLTETITMLMTDEDGKAKVQESLSQKNYNDILDSVQAIKERAEGLDHFVNNFRTLTKLPEAMRTERISVADLVESVLKIMNAQLVNVEVITDLGNEELELEIDVALIEQILINLITNSLTAMSNAANPQLILKGMGKDEYIVIRVQDNGIGIPREKLAIIFMPFYSTKEKASGIGLSFVKQVLRLHNASIQVQSNPGEGSTFSMNFQRYRNLE